MSIEDFGKVDWELENDSFGKVNWDNWNSCQKWVQPEKGFCYVFVFDGIEYLRDSEDFIWTTDYLDKTGKVIGGKIIGQFHTDKETIIPISSDIEIEYDDIE